MDIIEYGEKHEKLNIITHGMGALLCLLLFPFMIYKAYHGVDTPFFCGTVIFSFTAFLTFLTSTLYHSAKEMKQRNFYRILDHICIYLLIGGSYAAFVLKFCSPSTGWVFLSVQWIIIIFGIIFKVFFTGRYEAFSIALYLILGWSGFFIYDEVFPNMSTLTFNLLLFGGLSYSVGVIFYAGNKIPYNHMIWHLFVLAGCGSHGLAVYSCL